MRLKLGSLLLAVLVCAASLASVLGQPSSYSGGGTVNTQKQKQKQQSNVTRPATTTTTNSGKPPPRQQAGEDEYLIGVGIGDITGPAADINLVSLLRQLSELLVGASSTGGRASPPSPARRGPSTARQNAAGPPLTSGTSILNDVMRIQHPSWRELSDVKLQLKINMNSLLLQLNSATSSPLLSPVASLIRWAMPNRLKMQAEYTYANLVVQS